MAFQTIGFIGLGLIGGSIAKKMTGLVLSGKTDAARQHL